MKMEGSGGGSGRDDEPDDIQLLRNQLAEIERRELIADIAKRNNKERAELRKKIRAKGYAPVA